MKRLLVNDMLTVGGERTFWHLLQEWFDCEFVGGDFATLVEQANIEAICHECTEGQEPPIMDAKLIIRNASYFGPIDASQRVPTISLLQDIFTEGPQREMQLKVMGGSTRTVFNSEFTKSKYESSWVKKAIDDCSKVIPLPVDFSLFEPGNVMGLQQALSLPDNCILWIGACREAGHVKGFDTFIKIVRMNPDLHFVGVFKDAIPDYFPPNLRPYVRIPHDELVRIIGACRVGLCTSRTESQHLAGIEMGACGLPLVVPPIGAYYQRKDMPGMIVPDGAEAGAYSSHIRAMLGQPLDRAAIRTYWKREFDIPVIREKWEKLVQEVECSGRS